MANIHIPDPWENIAGKITDENIYQHRRKFIKKLGLGSIASLAIPGVLASCGSGFSGESQQLQQQKEAPSFTFKGMKEMYPASPNEAYRVERTLTKEYDATHYNNFYEFIHPSDRNIYNVYKFVHTFDTSDWNIEVKGLCNKPGIYSLEKLMKKLPLEERTYRFRCVERWSMTVPWTGFSMAAMLKLFEPQSKATHIRFISASFPKQMPGVKNQTWYPWPYREGLRIDEGMNELAFMATGIYGKPLPKQNGAPVRVIVPWKYGYKNPKSIVAIEFVDEEPETFWHELQAREYPFLSNVDPEVPHPRWSQAQEWRIPDRSRAYPTQKYNGYGQWVAGLYR